MKSIKSCETGIVILHSIHEIKPIASYLPTDARVHQSGE